MKEEFKKLQEEALHAISEKWATIAAITIMNYEIKEDAPEHERLQEILCDAARSEIQNLIETNKKVQELIEFVLEKRKGDNTGIAVH